MEETDSKKNSQTFITSGEKIASNIDLSTEILLRLPVRSVLRSKCVSKLWYSLVTDPRFALLRNSIPNPNPNPNPDPPSGLFLERPSNQNRQEYDFVPFDVDNPIKPPFKTLLFDRDASGIAILHSVNGLLLCHGHCLDLHRRGRLYDYMYYVYNPSVNQFTTLPKLDGCPSRSIRGMSLAFDPLKSPHFRVVCVRSVEWSDDDYDDDDDDDEDDHEHEVYYEDDVYQIDIYSSETGEWRASGEPFPYLLDTEFMGGVYWNNALHWLNKEAFVSYFKLGGKRIYQLLSPDIRSNYERISNRLVESRDSVLVIDVLGPHCSRFDIFEMHKDYSGWVLKYRVHLGEIAEVYPEMFLQGYIFAVQCLVLGEKDEDSFFVVEIPGKAIRYNLESGTFHKLCDFALQPYGSDFSIGDGVFMFGRWEFGRWPGAFLFTESLAAV